jgi:hypothetical protein
MRKREAGNGGGVPRGLPKSVKSHLEKCKQCALAAVEAYNRPGPRFRTAQYLVMITMAWTGLFHAIFFKRKRRPWYRKSGATAGTAIRYQKVDGEPKHWDLQESLSQYFGSNHPPERKNLEFLLGLRNKVEHRNLPELDASLYGECQAALMNLEELLVQEFGRSHALADYLSVSLQFSQTIPPEKKRAAQVLASSSTKSATNYIETFRGGLPSTVLSSMKYSFNVFLVPRVANRESASDAAVQFVHVDEASPAELERLERLNVLIREKHIPIANLDMFKPSQVVAEVRKHLQFKFNMATHTRAWKHYGIRPDSSALKPEVTQSQYCIYDHVHGDYLYTRAWIERLRRDLSDHRHYDIVLGRSQS